MIDCEGNNNLQDTESKRGKAGVTPDKEPDSNRARKSNSQQRLLARHERERSVRQHESEERRQQTLLAQRERERSAIQQESNLQRQQRLLA